MDIYNVSYLDGKGIKRIGSLTAFTAEDAKATLQQMVKIDNNNFFDCKILRVWQRKPATAKQQLAQKYGFIIGSVMGAKSQLLNPMFKISLAQAANNDVKMHRALSLVEMQFTKLERDIRDCFKLAGLKIK